MKRPFALKTRNIKSQSIKEEASYLKSTEETLAEKIKLCKTIQSKYKKLISCEKEKLKLKAELATAVENYEQKIVTSQAASPQEFSNSIQNIIKSQI